MNRIFFFIIVIYTLTINDSECQTNGNGALPVILTRKNKSEKSTEKVNIKVAFETLKKSRGVDYFSDVKDRQTGTDEKMELRTLAHTNLWPKNEGNRNPKQQLNTSSAGFIINIIQSYNTGTEDFTMFKFEINIARKKEVDIELVKEISPFYINPDLDDPEIVILIQKELSEYFPYIPTDEEIQDKADWDEAVRINTISSYQKYLTDNQDGKYADKAKEKIKIIEDQIDENRWEEAVSINSISSYQSYLKDHPDGIYADKARERIKVECVMWNDANEKATKGPYREYQKKYPNGDYVKTAIINITNLKRRGYLKNGGLIVGIVGGAIAFKNLICPSDNFIEAERLHKIYADNRSPIAFEANCPECGTRSETYKKIDDYRENRRDAIYWGAAVAVAGGIIYFFSDRMIKLDKKNCDLNISENGLSLTYKF